MKRFDIEKFTDRTTGIPYTQGASCKFVLPDGSHVLQQGCDDAEGRYEFMEYIKKPNSPYAYQTLYHKDGSVNHCGHIFHRNRIGIWKHYDRLGNLIKEVDYEVEFKLFGREALMERVKAEHGINLMNPAEIYDFHMRNAKPEIQNTYEIITIDKIDPYCYHDYLIDGNTGETLLITDWERHGDYTDIIDLYKSMLKKKINL